MYEKVLKGKIQSGNMLVYKNWRDVGSKPEPRYFEDVVIISKVEQDGICIVEHGLFGVGEDSIFEYSEFKPIVISEEYLKTIGIEEDYIESEDLVKEGWKTYGFGSRNFAYQHGALYEYTKVKDTELVKNKVKIVSDLLRYVHEVQNFIADV